MGRASLHSKVAVSQSKSFPVTCFADVNIEQMRSAGALCIYSENLRSLYANYIYNGSCAACNCASFASDFTLCVCVCVCVCARLVPTNQAGGPKPATPSVGFSRVDRCTTMTAGCTPVTQVESLQDALAYSATHALSPDPLLPVAAPGALPATKPPNPDYSDAPCKLKPDPCASHPFPPGKMLLQGSSGFDASWFSTEWLAEMGWKDEAPASAPSEPVPARPSGPSVPVPAVDPRVPPVAPTVPTPKPPTATTPTPAPARPPASSRVEADVLEPLAEAEAVETLKSRKWSVKVQQLFPSFLLRPFIHFPLHL